MKHILLILLTGCFGLHPLPAQTVSDTVHLTFYTDTVTLSEVVVTEHRTPATTGRWSDMTPIELVNVAGSNGDLYKALQTLPGTQVQGETGHLLVRGGSSEETQTYIDGLHVLKPYTSTGINSVARSRYSTFMFSGVNLASGGASLEYGQALSAVLPLETKDESPVTKLGVNASIVGVGGGGTRAFERGSLSVDLTYQNLALYNKVYSGRCEFEEPYKMFSAATQFRHSLGKNVLLKIYGQYDRTDFGTYEGEGTRRCYLEYPELTTPQYATRHNVSFVLRWFIPRLRLILGLTDTYASGRPWHNPDRPGLMNDEVKPYNSLDAGLTFLLSPKVIINASATNVLSRCNEFGRVDGRPVLASADHFFYLGVFITLGKKAAYDVSNF